MMEMGTELLCFGNTPLYDERLPWCVRQRESELQRIHVEERQMNTKQKVRLVSKCRYAATIGWKLLLLALVIATIALSLPWCCVAISPILTPSVLLNPFSLLEWFMLVGIAALFLAAVRFLIKKLMAVEPVAPITRKSTCHLPDAESLVRPCKLSVISPQTELLRAAGRGSETPEGELLRAADPGQETPEGGSCP